MADEIKKTVVVQTEVEGGESIDDLAKNVSIAGVSFNSMKASINGAISSLRGLTIGTKLFGRALLATGIGAILIALGSLITFLTKSQRGMDLVTKAAEAFSAVFNVLIDRVIKFGEGIFKLLSGDFKGAIDSIGSAFSGVADEIQGAIIQSQIFAQAVIDLEIAQIKFIRTQAILQRDLNEQRKISNDEAFTANERLEANLKAQEIQNELTLERIRLAELAFTKEREDQAGRTESQRLQRDNQKQFAEAQAVLIDAVAKGSTDQIKLLTKEKALRSEVLKVQKEQNEEERKAAEARELAAETEEANRQVFVTTRKKDTSDLERLEARGAAATIKNEGSITKAVLETRIARNQAADEREQRILELAQLERDNAANSLDLIGSVASQIAALGLENAGLTKSIAVFESVVNTLSAITRALPNVPLAIAVGILGAAQTAKILSTPLPTKAEGGPIDIGGQRHSAGGTKFFGSDGTAFEAERGEKLFVLSRSASSAFDSLSSFNSMFSGNSGGSFLQEGGLVTPSISSIDSDFNVAQMTIDIIRELPAPEVSVLKIERARNEVLVTRRRADLN